LQTLALLEPQPEEPDSDFGFEFSAMVATYSRLRVIDAPGFTTPFIPLLDSLCGSGSAARVPLPPIPWRPRAARLSAFPSG
jgi:hypothetical protein